MNRREIQVWNDAVRACQEAAWAEVEAMEQAAADGMPNPARVIVRAVAAQHRGDDSRQWGVVKFTAADFPQSK